MSRRFTALGLGVLLTVSTPLAALAQDPAAGIQKVTTVEGITEYRLANGLRVLLFPDPSTQKVTVNLTVFVGSRHEGYGETGMAHLLEHMVFKGTPTFPDVPKALRDHGAQFNGTTWVDRTNYFETMPATDENLEFGIKLEADRMMNSFVKREDLISEMTVVRNEFERGENDPERILDQRMMAAAYEWHNYGKSTIGNRSDIERVPIENLQAFYKQYYQPDNAMLVVAGKFDPAKALGFVAKYFGSIPKPTRKLNTTYTEEPPQDGERTVILRRVGTVGAVGAVYHVPAAAHPDFPAVEVMANILLTEPAGRLYQALVVAKKATSVSGAAYAWHDPGVFSVTAMTEPEKLEIARDALIETIENFATTKITDEELERAKRQMSRRTEQLLADSNRLAIQLSEWAARGDWRLFFLNRDRVEKVTAADVTRVAAEYLKRTNRTVGMYIPTKEPERSTIPETPQLAKLLEGYTGKAAVAEGETFDPTPENIEARVERGKIAGIQTAVLPKKTRGEVVRFRMTLRFGTAESLKGLTTAAELLGEMLQRGTKKYDRQAIQDELEKLASRLSVSSDVSQVTFTLQSKRENLGKALDLLGSVLREPTFPESELELLKREMQEQLDKGLTEPTALAQRALFRKLAPYPPEDIRYTPTLEEEITRLKAVTGEDLRKVYAQVGAHAGELAIVGDFDPATVQKQLEGLLGGWTGSVPYERVARPARTDLTGGREKINTPDKANAFYLAGLVFAGKDTDPDYASMEVANFLFGGGTLSSRLGNRVRQKEGLSYGVRSNFTASAKDPAARFVMYAICNPVNVPKVDAAIADELAKFLKEGPSDKELAEGKKAYVEQLKVQRADDGQLASLLATNLFAGRTFQYYADLEKQVAGLTPAAVLKAFQTHIDPKKLFIIEAGDFKSPGQGK